MDDYKAEIHLHTRVSDGAMTPEEAVKIARNRGLTAIAVTDHDTFRGSSLAERISRILGGPMIIHGNEVRTDLGDVLVYCDSPHPGNPTRLEELRDWADERNCLMVAAHPFHPVRSSIGLKILGKYRFFDAIEVWNARGPPCLNTPAIILAHKRGIPGTSGSDAHVHRELGTTPIVLPEEPTGVDDILEWIRKGRVKPTYRPVRLTAIPYILAWSIKRRSL